MAKYRVTAITNEGDTYTETIEAEDRFSVYRDYRNRGDRVLNLAEESSRKLFSLSFFRNIFEPVSQDEKVILVRNLAAMLEAGLTSSRALGVMERQTPSKRLKKIVGGVIADVRRGSTLSQSFGKYPDVFSSLLISMVRSGEESGKLSESLRVVAMQMERASALSKKIRGALMYPSIVVIAMVGIGILMLIYVVPTLTATFTELGTELPPTTKIIIGASAFLAGSPLLSLALFAGFVFFLLYASHTNAGTRALDWLFLKMPVIKELSMETNAARMARTMASLLSAGVDVILAISITRDVVKNSFYQAVLSEAEEAVTKGGALSKVLEKYPQLYPPLVSEMIAVGEETGRLSDMLKEIAGFYEESVEQKTKDLSTIIEPLLMLFIGAVVGFFALSMIAPIYSLSGSI